MDAFDVSVLVGACDMVLVGDENAAGLEVGVYVSVGVSDTIAVAVGDDIIVGVTVCEDVGDSVTA